MSPVIRHSVGLLAVIGVGLLALMGLDIAGVSFSLGNYFAGMIVGSASGLIYDAMKVLGE